MDRFVQQREQMKWRLQPVILRQEIFRKEIYRLLREGVNKSQFPVLPRTQRAYETDLSAGSTAVLADNRPQNGY